MTLHRFQVTGPHPVAGVDPGKVVELDPETVNVDALKYAGHIGPVEAPKPKGGHRERNRPE